VCVEGRTLREVRVDALITNRVAYWIRQLQEQEEQRLSFAYGQTKFRNPHWTRDDMQLVCDEMDLIVRGNN
jgi:hypothetical protein